MKLFKNIADLAIESLQAGQSVLTQGESTPGDNAGSVYYIITPGTAGVDDITLANGNIAVFQGVIGPHDHLESDITDLDKYDKAEVDEITVLKLWSNTGVIVGGQLTANGTLQFDIAAGSGVFLDPTDRLTLTGKLITSWGDKIGVNINNIGSQNITYISMDQYGNVIQRATKSYASLRTEIFLGFIQHPASVILSVIAAPVGALDTANTVLDYGKIINRTVTKGGAPTQSLTNPLSFDMPETEIFYIGANAYNSFFNPNFLTQPSEIQVDFNYVTGTGELYLQDQNVHTPALYDRDGLNDVRNLGGGGDRATIHRVYVSGGEYFILFGQIEYNDYAEAANSITSDGGVIKIPPLLDEAILLAYFVGTGNSVDLDGGVDSAILLPGGIGSGGGSGGGGGGVEEAPDDGTPYARQSLGWTGTVAANHTHVEGDVTDLDKYTQAQVDTIESGLQSQIDGKEPTITPKKGGFNNDYGSTAGTVAQGNDSRFTDPRDPNPHSHTKSDITDFDDNDYATSAQGAKADTALQTITGESIFDLNDVINTPTVSTNDLLAYNGSAFIPVPPVQGGGNVTSVFSRTGVITAEVGDYDSFFSLLGHAHTISDITDLTDNFYTESEIDAFNAQIAIDIAAKEDSFSKNTAFNKNFGSGSLEVCEGDDSRLNNARVPLSHGHDWSSPSHGFLDFAGNPLTVDTFATGAEGDLASSALQDLNQIGGYTELQTLNLSVDASTTNFANVFSKVGLLTFSNIPIGVYTCTVWCKVNTINFSSISGILWQGGIAPVATNQAGLDIIILTTGDQGANWVGSYTLGYA